MKKIKGTLDAFFEEGMEGFCWAIMKDGYEWHDALNILEEGQRLVVYDNSNRVYWDGEIKKDLTTNLSDDTAYSCPRQVVGGVVVHWLQEDVDPEKWAKMFFDEMRAELYLNDQI